MTALISRINVHQPKMPALEKYSGARKEFLSQRLPGFVNSVARVSGTSYHHKTKKSSHVLIHTQNTHKDFLVNIIRQFNKRFPLDKSDDWEPTAEDLMKVDDNAPDEEVEIPNPDDYPEISSEDYEKLLEGARERVRQARKRAEVSWFKFELALNVNLEAS